jgi:hypothetical protein
MSPEVGFRRLFGLASVHFKNIQIAVDVNGDLVRVWSTNYGFGSEYRRSKETEDLHQFVLGRIKEQQKPSKGVADGS